MADIEVEPLAQTQVVTSGRARLAVDDAGSGPAAVCLHAGVADRRSFWPLGPALTGAHRLVAWDRRGFGGTVVSEVEPYDWVDDQLAVLDHLGIDRAVLVGNSQGGRVALDTALAHPDRVGGLVLIGAAWTGAPDVDGGPAVAAIGAALDEADDRDDLDAINALEAHLWLDGPEQSAGRVTGAARRLFLDMNGQALALDDQAAMAREHPPAWERLGELTVPVAVVQGTFDIPGRLERARVAAQRIPHATFHALPGVAHVPTLECPAVCAALIADLVRAATG